MLKPQCNVELPKDCRTLLQTPGVVEYSEKCGGKYIYFGIETVEDKTIKLNFNIDGIPVFKSTVTQFWPILCSLGDYTPIMVSIIYGPSKPSSLEDFLADFLTELDRLVLEGISFENERVNVNVNAFICDAPAQAFLKCIKGHTGYNSCERCIVRGYYKDNRVILYSEEFFTARTDDEFKAWRYPAHQSRITPLAASDIPCVCGFCLDYMHMVCLGVVKHRILLNVFISSPLYKSLKYQIISFLFPVNYHPSLHVNLDHCTRLSVGKLLNLDSFFYILAQFVVYNVHLLIHLSDDFRNFGCSLNDISGFPFENHLQSIKSEECQKSNCSDGAYAFVKKERQQKNICQEQPENYFTQPCDSKLLNVVLVKPRQRMKRRNVDVSELYRKLVRLPVEHGYVLIPMLHTMDQ
ncbi:hypothetical protein MAR_024946, partial [Mya arenaria]